MVFSLHFLTTSMTWFSLCLPFHGCSVSYVPNRASWGVEHPFLDFLQNTGIHALVYFIKDLGSYSDKEPHGKLLNVNAALLSFLNPLGHLHYRQLADVPPLAPVSVGPLLSQYSPHISPINLLPIPQLLPILKATKILFSLSFTGLFQIIL